jgi:hypothetical protein
MRLAICALLVCVLGADDKKSEKITPENIEVGKVGVIEKLTVEKPLQADSTKIEDHMIIATFDGLRVLIIGYPAKGIGKGKILPKDQLWKVDHVLRGDATGELLAGCYVLKPDKPKKK